MIVNIKDYPYNKDCALAVTIDDLHPGPGFGRDFKEEFWCRIKQLWKEIPGIKITFFTVADWVDQPDWPDGWFWPLRKLFRVRRNTSTGRLALDRPETEEWIKELNSLVPNSAEFALHGLYHHNENRHFPVSQEFVGLSTQQTKIRLEKMLAIFERSGLKFCRGFRPPGWGATPELLSELKAAGVSYVASSADFKSDNWAKISSPQEISGLINFTANCYPEQFQRAVEIAKAGGVIVVHAHIVATTFGLKFVDRNFVGNLKRIVSEIRNQTMKKVWFATLGEITAFLAAKKNIFYTVVSENEVIFKNAGDAEIRGLTVCLNNQTAVLEKVTAKGQIKIDLRKLRKEKLGVSIILTVYNGERDVLESLQSISQQTYLNLEIIVVNDGSTDGTRLVLEGYIKSTGDSRIKLLNQNNGGRSNARNNGFKISTGEIVTFCEDDAKYDKEYIVSAVRHFEKSDRKLGGVIGPHYVWNRMESLNTRVKDIERRRNFLDYKPKSCWFYRRETFEKVGCFNENLELVEDVEPAIKLAKLGYHFIYEDNCRWLHKEPAALLPYLRRKFRGGVGMALLTKMGLKENLVPTGSSIPLLRNQDITKARQVSPENLIFIIFATYFEYVWWAATLLGYIYGSRMTAEKINQYLKRR